MHNFEQNIENKVIYYEHDFNISTFYISINCFIKKREENIKIFLNINFVQIQERDHPRLSREVGEDGSVRQVSLSR